MTESLLSELSRPGRRAVRMPALDVPPAPFPPELARATLPLPELSEPDVVRHYAQLARLNLSNVLSMQSSGSCTVKYNPVINEELAGLEGFADSHPLQPDEDLQGSLQVLFQLGQWLCEITGLPGVSLQPAAGAQAQLAGLLMLRRHFADAGEAGRDAVIVTSTCHGSNPASAAMAGYRVLTVGPDARGNVDLAALRALLDARVAAFMYTNPNTHGVFEEQAAEIADLVRKNGSLLFLDGANLNAIVGKVKPADLGVDLCTLNLHKTFSTPHGGNGPGAGALLVRADLEKYLPTPVLVQDASGAFRTVRDRPESIGRVRSFYGQFGILLRAFAYILAQGPAGLRQQAEDAVLHANYLLHLVREEFPPWYDRAYFHECSVSVRKALEKGVGARDIGLRLMDYGYHPPNVPALLNNEALLIEPTETESRESLEAFAAALNAIAREARDEPNLFGSVPHTTPVRRLKGIEIDGRPDVAARDRS